jgi:hypothetical protein
VFWKAIADDAAVANKAAKRARLILNRVEVKMVALRSKILKSDSVSDFEKHCIFKRYQYWSLFLCNA